MPAIQLVRHATLSVSIDGTTLLVDPMLGAPGDIPPIPNTPNDRENPLVPLPDVDLDYDAVLVTHRHRDHFDDAATDRLDDDVPLLCQPAEADDFRADGFTDVRPVEDSSTLDGILITRTPARHGYGAVGQQMGPVSGFVLEGDTTLYLAGDTVWYDEVAETIDRRDPDVVVVNAGAARFVDSDPITMDEADVASTVEYADCDVIAVHMDAINHCLLTRADLRKAVSDVLVPEDGERLRI